MIVVSVMYPAGAGTTFDMDYYRTKHLPLVSARWNACGLRKAKVLCGVGAPGGGPATWSVIALLTFGSAADVNQALAQHGAEIVGDIPNYSRVQPIIQTNDVLL
jgi:uncharacterized protein (TIGR02118 family)